MRTRRSAGISFFVAIAVLLVATVAGAKDGGRPAEAAREAGSHPNGNADGAGAVGDGSNAGGTAFGAPGMTCIKQNPDCHDSGIVVPPVTGDDGSPISCGQTIESGTGPDGTVAYAPCPGEEPTPVEPQPQVVTPTPGMADVNPRPYDSVTIGDDDRTLSIDFWSGIAPCDVLDHVDVSYGADVVTVTLFAGYDPSAGNVACIDIAQFERVVVTLDEPLNGRTIVDGALAKDAQAA
jgi:hypothetical protein